MTKISDLTIKQIGTYSMLSTNSMGCTVCHDAEWGDVLINGVCGKCLRAENERLTAELAAERERNRWIPVGERLPDNPDYLFIEPVLICHGDDEIVSAVYYKGDLLADDIGFYINELMDKKLNDVTYWRPIVPPTEKGGE